jgi:hypothetical protein
VIGLPHAQSDESETKPSLLGNPKFEFRNPKQIQTLKAQKQTAFSELHVSGLSAPW